MEIKHLHPSLHAILLLEEEARINKIQQDSWIGYSRAQCIIAKLEDLLIYPRVIRMPNLLIVGDTNNGKTILANRFFVSHKPYLREADQSFIAPIVYCQAPPKPDEKRFYNNLLDSLFVPYRVSDRVEHKQQQLLNVLRRMETKMLIIDEIHHILAGNLAAQRIFLNVIKYLANELRIVIVGVGTKDALAAINTDPQLSNRFEPVILPKWTMNEEYLRLLASMEYLTPLKKPSNLVEYNMSQCILGMSEGTIGEISTVIKKAAILAIKQGTEQISRKILDSIDYIPPSERKKHFESY
ncbi:MAG: AAA family ATPase [Paludibacter sp.]|nr:AAA family ATPase [Paludibacter sp.]